MTAPSPRSWYSPDEPFAVRQDHVRRLDGRLRRQAAVVLPERHGTAGEGGPHAQLADRPDLNVDGVLHAVREEVVVVRGGGAAGEQQFRERNGGGQLQVPRLEPRPHGVQVLQPREQRGVGHRTPGAGERLVEVVVRVDQARQQDVTAGVERLLAGCGRLLAGGQDLGDDCRR